MDNNSNPNCNWHLAIFKKKKIMKTFEVKYKVEGITCNNCVNNIKEALQGVDGIEEIKLNKENGVMKLVMNHQIPIEVIQNLLPKKYAITIDKKVNVFTSANSELIDKVEQSKFSQLKPLILILFYIAVTSNMLHVENWSLPNVMLDFMGIFFIVFSFFKMLDLRGFPESFSMYDPLAKRVPVYGWIYPFIETVLGLMFLMRIEISIALIVTLVILIITTIGVSKTLLDKKSIRCACLGTALKLPMTEATFIENAIMIVMAITMLTLNI